MGALGSDAAIETADVVLMTDAPAKVAEAIGIAKHTRQIVLQNIMLALAVKGVFIVFGSFGLASMWEAVFADMGTALLALLNATRAFSARNQI
jgi:Cd2+/Zn2+-exporting ATPase